MRWKNNNLLLFVIIFISIQPTVQVFQTAQFNVTYRNSTRTNHIFSYRFSVPNGEVVRFKVSSDADVTSPLLVVFREVTNVVAIQVPHLHLNNMYNTTTRTLCPVLEDEIGNHSLSVEMSSLRPVNFTFYAEIQQNFFLSLEKPLTLNAAFNSPIYVRYTIPNELDSIIIKVNSKSTECMTVGIHPIQCPVLDSEDNVNSGGLHQSLTTAGFLTVQRSTLTCFNLIFVVHQDDSSCSSDYIPSVPIVPVLAEPREKSFTVTVTRVPLYSDYFIPVIATSVLLVFIYFLVISLGCIMTRYETTAFEYERQSLQNRTEIEDDQQPSTSYDITNTEAAVEAEQQSDTISLNDYDYMEDITDKCVVRMKINVKVADFCLKTHEQRDDKYNGYTKFLIILSFFYCLPVCQLVLNWLTTVRLSGNLDLCWYNFACSRPFWIFFNANNIFSNVGYVSSGILFLIMVFLKQKHLKEIKSSLPHNLRNDYGLPQHSGLLYSMGIALILEGILSASYHVCPTNANYQFDTSFMYVIGLLGILQIYQLRHPDINAHAHKAYMLMAFFVAVSMGGVYLNYLWYWIVFSIGYVFTMFVISVEFYFKGMWQFNLLSMWNGIKMNILSSQYCSFAVPAYKGRFFFLVIANLINFGYIIWGVLTTPKDFPSFLLLPFIANLFLYMMYYIAMKFFYKERLCIQALIFVFASIVCWLGAIWFFMHHVTDWSVPPAASRELNKPCVLFDFFDKHDVWHLLSSIAIFTSFSILLYIDDDLIFIQRAEISVF